MKVEVKIKKIQLNYDTPFIIKRSVYNESITVKESFTFKIKTYHDLLFTYLKILLEKNSFFTCTIGYTEISFKDIKNHTCVYSIYDPIYETDFTSYPFEERKSVGEMVLEFSITEEEFEIDHSHNPSILDKIFHGIFNVEKNTRISSILAKLITFGSANTSSYIYSSKGFFYLVNYYIKEEKKFSYSTVLQFLSSLKREDESSVSSLNQTNYSIAEETNLNYKLFDRSFYVKYREYLHYAICSYGRSILTNNLVRKIIKEPTANKSCLELLDENINEFKLINLEGKDYNPIFVAFECKDAFVISFRGTFSVRDVSCDLKFDYKEFYNGFAHEGFGELAEQFIKNYYSKVKIFIENKKLIITGHSLGGSVAQLVGYILLKNKMIDEDKLEVVAFSPAPTLSKNIVQDDMFGSFITFTVSNDSVPFLSYGSLCDLRYLTTSLGIKFSIFKSNPEEINEYILKVREFLLKNDLYPKLYIPGKIFQFKEFYEENKGKLRDLFSLFREDNAEKRIFLCKEFDYTFCNEFILDINAPLHHMPNYLMNVFNSSIKLNDHIEEKDSENS